jgi:copper chaperone CopZ
MDLMEMLKAIFNGEALTFDQFAEKINQSADVKLGNLAGGQYVDKNKYDDISRQLETANASLADYDPEWKSKLEQAQAEGDKKLNDYKFEQAVESAINNAGAADIVSVKANIDMSKVTQSEDGSIVGLDEQLTELKQSKPFLFKTEEQKKKLDLGGPTGGAKAKSGSNIKSAVEDYYK